MEQHTMYLIKQYDDGSQEWYCPICQRRFIISWPPNYKRTILEEGNQDVIHTGGTEGLNMGKSSIEKFDDFGENDILVELNDPNLGVFTDYINRLIN